MSELTVSQIVSQVCNELRISGLHASNKRTMEAVDSFLVALRARVAELETECDAALKRATDAEGERDAALALASDACSEHNSKAVQYIDLGEQFEALQGKETELRRLLWLRHGCPLHALYGDDGEMQCSACVLDFKRATPEKIYDRFMDAGVKAFLDSLPLSASRVPPGQAAEGEITRGCICSRQFPVDAQNICSRCGGVVRRGRATEGEGKP